MGLAPVERSEAHQHFTCFTPSFDTRGSLAGVPKSGDTLRPTHPHLQHAPFASFFADGGTSLAEFRVESTSHRLFPHLLIELSASHDAPLVEGVTDIGKARHLPLDSHCGLAAFVFGEHRAGRVLVIGAVQPAGEIG